MLRVADVQKEADFYTSLMGMKPVSQSKDDVWLRFGENTLVLRPANGKPYCNEFGLVIADYDATKVKAELDKRGVKFVAQSAEASRRFIEGARGASLTRMKERMEKEAH